MLTSAVLSGFGCVGNTVEITKTDAATGNLNARVVFPKLVARHSKGATSVVPVPHVLAHDLTPCPGVKPYMRSAYFRAITA